ncbi:MAG: nuclear transport factor 2 family protein [Acidimicrobiales bacterium]|nr:nuclear transport factor 2 family protein [Acidimicrobiales bacterium]
MSRDDIEKLVHDYSDAVVYRNVDQWLATWADDAIWDLGKGRRVEGRDAIGEMWLGAMDRFEAVIQTIANGSATLDGDHGTGRWYVHELIKRAGGEVGVMVGHYDDRYVRVDGSWRFAARELVIHYQGPPDLSGHFRPA